MIMRILRPRLRPYGFGIVLVVLVLFVFFFFNDTATTEIYTLSLHDALPICTVSCAPWAAGAGSGCTAVSMRSRRWPDRKSTRLNSSHLVISYAVFCLKKKKNALRYTTHRMRRACVETARHVQTPYAPVLYKR